MNKNQLAKNVGHVVQLRLIARRPAPIGDLPPIDDDWIIERADDRGLNLHNLRTGYIPLLAYDQIHSYMSNPIRDIEGRKHGFLQLRVQLSLLPQGLQIEPLAPGEWEPSDGVRKRRRSSSAEHGEYQEPFRIPSLNDPELKHVVASFKERGEECCLPLIEEKDTRIVRGYRVAHYPGTQREIWVGYHAGRYEHLLMLKPRRGRGENG